MNIPAPPPPRPCMLASLIEAQSRIKSRLALRVRAGRYCFRSQFATTRKSLRAAPPKSEFMDTYQPRFLGIGSDLTVQMCEMTPAPPAICRTPSEMTLSPFLQVA